MDVPYYITHNNNTFTITFPGGERPSVYFSSLDYVLVVHGSHSILFGADLNSLTMLDWRYCTSPSEASRDDLISAIRTLGSASFIAAEVDTLTIETRAQPDVDGGADLGSTSRYFGTTYTDTLRTGSAVVENGVNATTITSTATNARSVTLPDEGGTVVLDTATQTLSNKTLNSPFINQILVGERTFTFPQDASTDELVGRTSTAILKNKVIVCNGGLEGSMCDSTTNTKQVYFSLSGKTASAPTIVSFSGGSQTITFPGGGESYTLATLNTAQTLTNKTLVSPSISSISNTGTLTLPTTTTTLVGRDTTDSLTNKTIQFTTSGGTPSTLDYYEETTFSTTFSGPFTETASQTVQIIRIGKIVTLRIPEFSKTATTGSAQIVSTTALESRFRPATNIRGLNASVINNSAETLGTVGVSIAGTITIYPGAYNTTFTGSGNAGIRGCCITYILN
jgi:hypothetical protein